MAKKKKQEDDDFSFLKPSESLRKRLLKEEFKLRKGQPQAWTRIKYRKIVKLPKDLLKKSRKKQGKRIFKLEEDKTFKKKKRKGG